MKRLFHSCQADQNGVMSTGRSFSLVDGNRVKNIYAGFFRVFLVVFLLVFHCGVNANGGPPEPPVVTQVLLPPPQVTPLPVVIWPSPVDVCVPPNPDGTTIPDSELSPYVLQLAAYLRSSVAGLQITEDEAIAQFAATAKYFNLPADQIDRLLGLPTGTAQAFYDMILNPYDWYSYYFDGRVTQSGEISPTVGPLKLMNATTSVLDIIWLLDDPNGLRNVEYFLFGDGAPPYKITRNVSGRFDNLIPSTTFTIEARAEAYNAFLLCWHTVLQIGYFRTLDDPPPPPPMINPD